MGIGQDRYQADRTVDLEAFIEPRQERACTSRGEDAYVCVIVPSTSPSSRRSLPVIIQEKDQLILPKPFPRAMNPKDVKKLIDVIHKSGTGP